MNKIKISIVGVTGLVGNVLIKVLEERGFNNIELLPVASSRSMGKTIHFAGREHPVISIDEAIASTPDIAIFSAGSNVSLHYAPLFAEKGTYVIDNSSAWRMYDHIPLIVPEINGKIIKVEDRIIANPNCSTLQMVMALAPLHEHYQIKRLVISTYQSVSGTGIKAVRQLMGERNGEEVSMSYPHPIDLNVLPHGGDFDEHGDTSEETKLVNETRKILGDDSIQITATVARVPVIGGHSEAVNVEFTQDFTLADIRRHLTGMPGVVVMDVPSQNIYPMPIYSEGKDDVFVGRLRRDHSVKYGLNMWITADNLRKGAATNAVQIAELIMKKYINKREAS